MTDSWSHTQKIKKKEEVIFAAMLLLPFPRLAVLRYTLSILEHASLNN